ncbi:S-layer homology domain-containing protein [Caldisalinibacter kiritimatiensis]|uniref:NLP/P60:S-layer protein n=1 Tax=Caldisalinibacter kiritimatiensis TaxID=1304284 RepID=R1AX49_9FIRM|nr:S-layer homology domain-containing protein [Caldisalinibacter kiritimatiensis]EOD01788.1 NLP/P60:S-layer protein [Caldisalinibacter kiritimatiensis]
MAKKVFLITLITLILVTSVSFADINDGLDNHWAKDLVDETFVSNYLNHLLNQDNGNFDPDKEITKGNFTLALFNLIKEYDSSLKENDSQDINYITFLKENLIIEEEFASKETLLRKDAVKIIMKALEKYTQLTNEQLDAPYKDLEGLSNEYISYILKANKLGIIKGYLDNTFRPNKSVSQVESIIILQRVKGELDMNSGSIPFKVVSNDKSYSVKKESVNVEEKQDKVIVKITKEFPTSGYTMDISKISKVSDEKYNIHLKINKPKSGMMTLQVITYKTITIEIDKKYLEDGELNFTIVSDSSFFKKTSK